jgi:hypothetical protein
MRAARFRELREYLGVNSPAVFQFYVNEMRSIRDDAEQLYLSRWQALTETTERHHFRRARTMFPRAGELYDPHETRLMERYLLLRRRFAPHSLFPDLLTVSTPSLDYQRIDQQFDAVLTQFAEQVCVIGASLLPQNESLAASRFVEPRSLKRRLAPLRVFKISDAERLVAADRIAEMLGHVIHPGRWRWVKRTRRGCCRRGWWRRSAIQSC